MGMLLAHYARLIVSEIYEVDKGVQNGVDAIEYRVGVNFYPYVSRKYLGRRTKASI